MKILVYYGRGLQGPGAVRALLNLQKRCDLDIVFLSKTHLDGWPAELLHRKMKMDFKEVVRNDGHSSGFLLLWKKKFKISLRFKMKNFIDVNVEEGQDFVWHFTSTYGEPRWQDKHYMWQLMMGDFNEILYPFKKEGANPRPINFM
jgi:hypothetical protein